MPRELPKSDALSALAELRSALLDPAQEITGLLRRQMAASVDYAMERIEAIEELKKARPKPKQRPVFLEPPPNGSGRSTEAVDGESGAGA